MIGGGNFWRGRTSETIDRPKADQIGMLATIMNCIYVSEIFRSVGMDTEIFPSWKHLSASSLEKSFVMLPHKNGVKISVSIPTERKIM